jgi:hypothetical protein
MRPFEIRYKIISEIRHGSEFNLAIIETVGECKFKLTKIIAGRINI